MEEGEVCMKRILVLVTLAVVMAAMVAAVAVPAFALTGTNPQGQGKDIVGSNCGNYPGDFYTVNQGSKGYVNHCLK
jgi:hypothetical protein